MARYNLQDVKAKAAGQWSAVINRAGGIPDDFLNTRHGPCPKCGGTKPWRVFGDFEETGGAICNHCGKFGDGIAVIQWFRGCNFQDAISLAGDFLGVTPISSGKGRKKSQAPKDPTSNLEWLDWNEQLVAIWCLRKSPIKPATLRAIGARIARYRKRYTVIALPSRDKSGTEVGWVIYDIGGGALPVFHGKGQPIEWTKKGKITPGSRAGWVKR